MQVTLSQLETLGEQITDAMMVGNLHAASVMASCYAELRWGSPDRVVQLGDREMMPRPGIAAPLSVGKLRHDIEQLQYLCRCGVLAHQDQRVAALKEVLARLVAANLKGQTAATTEEASQIGEFYARRMYVRPTGPVRQALSDSWRGREVEEAFIAAPLSPVIIDSFLSEDALQSLHLFCMQSTIWTTNRYAHGRLGSFFRDGFNCPLLLQIAQELRAALGRVLSAHPLRQLWAFKYGHVHPSNTTHADFAAVNVNFWITPDSANLDPATGGLLVFRTEAPMDWKFDSYNRDVGAIHAYLERVRSTAVRIPYRANRAVIFCSDLFHATDSVTFRPGYENRRINVTMLYGDRMDAVRRAAAV